MMMSSNFPRFCPFVRGIHRLPAVSPHKPQWAFMFSLIWAWTNGWANNRDAGDLRRHRAHFDFIVMNSQDADSTPHSVYGWNALTLSYCTRHIHLTFIVNLDNCELNFASWQPWHNFLYHIYFNIFWESIAYSKDICVCLRLIKDSIQLSLP